MSQSLADVLNPRLSDYPSPDTVLPMNTGSDTQGAMHYVSPPAAKAPTTVIPKSTTPITPSFSNLLPIEGMAIYRQLVNAARQGSFAFDSALTQLKIPAIFNLPVMGKQLSFARQSGNVTITYDGEVLVAIPLLLVAVVYAFFVAIWLISTRNANWNIWSRILGCFGGGATALAIILEWLLFRKGWDKGTKVGWASSFNNVLIPMFTKMVPKGGVGAFFTGGKNKPMFTKTRRRRKKPFKGLRSKGEPAGTYGSRWADASE